MSVTHTSEPAIRPPHDGAAPPPDGTAAQVAHRPPDDIVEDAHELRRRSARQVRHTARTKLHQLVGDDEALEDADLLCPQAAHDLGRKTSKPPRRAAKPGRRDGFKVWKTPFWKRRTSLRAERNAAARRLAEIE